MKIKSTIFLSHKISKQNPVYGGRDLPVVIKKVKSIKKGDSCNTMFWSFSNHIGTHIDAPLHFINKGKSICEFKPGDLIFTKVKLITLKNIPCGYMITSDDLKEVGDCDLLLIKTRFEIHRNKAVYWKDSVYLSSELAEWLKKKCPSLRNVGIDCISISNLKRREIGRQAHKAFLGRGILLIEDMKLNDLGDDPDMVIAAPILVEGADASPCTVLAINYK